MNPKALLSLANSVMPFGKYAGRKLVDLPETYVVWFHRKGFPKGELGELLQLLYEIKLNGLEHLLRPLLSLNKNSRDKTNVAPEINQ